MTFFNFKLKGLIIPSILGTCLIIYILLINHTSLNFKNQFYHFSSNLTLVLGDYPGSFVQHFHPKPANSSYCNFNFGFPNDFKIDINDLSFGPELYKLSPYRVLYNVIESQFSEKEPQVTYATHVTTDFLNYVPELTRYWDGYISVAAYVSDLEDLLETLAQLQQFCNCLPQMSKVAVHLVFHYNLTPLNIQRLETDATSDCHLTDCTKTPCKNKSVNPQDIYPINVCRNVARLAAQTEFVLVSDVQLMPSENLARKFMDMLKRYKFNNVQYPLRVFVLPVFEVDKNENIPRDKDQLKNLLRNEKAVYFHRLVCTHCQKFPGLENWLESKTGDVIKPLLTTKREVPYNRWEPIYIGTKNEPYYNEELSWEGLQDKMLQMLEMCLIGYNFIILDGGFLVHWPGIKRTKNRAEYWRQPFEKDNTRQYKRILKRLSFKYSPNRHCKLQ